VLRCGGDDGGLIDAWALPPSCEPSEVPTLLFAPLSGACEPSDLLVCTSDRRFVSASSGSVVEGVALRPVVTTAASPDVSAFTAAFGALRPPTANDARGNGAGRGGGSAWRPMVDAPSHALPSLLTLLPA